MATPYAAGRYYEYKCVNELRADGYDAVRTAGSHGPFDVIAWNIDELKLIQVKKLPPNTNVYSALHQAKSDWTRYHYPPECCVTLETWIYSYHHLDKFTH